MSDLQLVPVNQPKNVKAQEVEMRVPMYSYGCERKMRKALSHIKGLYSVEANAEQQRVKVVGMVDRNEVLEAIRAKRKEAHFWTNDIDQICFKLGVKSDNPTINASSKSKTSEDATAGKPSNKLLFAKKLFSWKGRKFLFGSLLTAKKETYRLPKKEADRNVSL